MQNQKEDRVIVAGVSGEKWSMKKVKTCWIWKTELHEIFNKKLGGLVVLVSF